MLKSIKAIVNKSSHQKRFDVASALMFSDFSRKKIKSIIDNGGAYLNKKRIKVAKNMVFFGDVIELYWDDKTSQNLALNKKNIIFENQDFIILDKPAGIPVQGTLESDKKTILYALNKFDPGKYPIDGLFLVHRLDKETSGLMIIAKTRETQKIFEDLFREHKIKKTYFAICFYTPKNKEGQITYPIVRDTSRKNTYFASLHSKNHPNQKTAETNYFLTKTLNYGAALIECKPKTGRTHQIRVHLAAIGCPIVGDKTYAQNVYGHPYAKAAVRHLLHSKKLDFEFKQTFYNFDSPLPEDFDFKE